MHMGIAGGPTNIPSGIIHRSPLRALLFFLREVCGALSCQHQHKYGGGEIDLGNSNSNKMDDGARFSLHIFHGVTPSDVWLVSIMKSPHVHVQID